MKNKLALLTAGIVALVTIHSAAANPQPGQAEKSSVIPIKFLNKVDVPFVVIGNSDAKPDSFTGTALSINPGVEATIYASAKNPKIAFWENTKPEAAFVYRFNPAGKKSIDIRLVLFKGGYNIEPQTTALIPRFSINDIYPERAQCAETPYHKCPGKAPNKPTAVSSPSPYSILDLKEGASDAEILGLTPQEANDKNKVRKTYLAKSKIWHPDKRSVEPAKSRYAKFPGLTAKEEDELANAVFKRINSANENLMKTAK